MKARNNSLSDFLKAIPGLEKNELTTLLTVFQNEGAFFLHDIREWSKDTMMECGIKIGHAIKIKFALDGLPAYSPLKEFIFSVFVWENIADPIVKLFEKNGVGSVDELQYWKLYDFRTIGLYINYGLMIMNALKKKYSQCSISEDSLAELDKLRKELSDARAKIDELEGKATIPYNTHNYNKPINKEKYSKDNNYYDKSPIWKKKVKTTLIEPTPGPPLPENEPTATIVTREFPENISLVLKSKKFENPNGLEAKFFPYGNEFYMEFMCNQDRKLFFEEKKGKQIDEIPEEGIIIRLKVKPKIYKALLHNQEKIATTCKKLKEGKFIELQNEKNVLIFYTKSDNAVEIQKEICDEYENLYFKRTTCKPVDIRSEDGNFAYLRIFNKNCIEIANSRSCIVNVETEHNRNGRKGLEAVVVGSKLDCEEVSNKIYNLNLQHEGKKISIQASIDSNEENKEDEIQEEKENDQKRDTDNIEKFKRMLKNNIEKQKQEIENRLNVEIIAKVDEKYIRNGKIVEFTINMEAFCFILSDVYEAVNNFASDYQYEDIIDFNTKDDIFYKGNFLKIKAREIRQFAMSRGVMFTLNCDFRAKSRKSNVILKGIKNGVESTKEKILTILENYTASKEEITKKFIPLSGKDKFSSQLYEKTIIEIGKKIIDSYKREKMPNTSVSNMTNLTTNWEAIFKFEFGTIDITDLLNFKENITAALDEYDVLKFNDEKNLIPDIKARKFNRKAYEEECKVTLIIDEDNILLLGHKENLASAKETLEGKKQKRQLYPLDNNYHKFLKRKLESNKDIFSGVCQKNNISAFFSLREFSIVIHGTEKDITAGIEDIKVVLENLMKQTISEIISCPKEDVEILKKNEKKLFEIERQNKVDINLLDRPTCIKKAQSKIANGIKLIIKEGDICADNVEVIVNSANEELKHYGGVAKDIADAAGPQLVYESNNLVKQKKLIVGDVVTTTSGNLKIKFVFHAIVPIWERLNNKQEMAKNLEKVVINILTTANSLNIKTIAMPCLCAGIYGFPQDVAAATIIKTITTFSGNKSIQEIHLVDINKGAIEQFTLTMEKSLKSEVIIPEIKDMNWEPSYQWYWDYHEEKKKQPYDKDQNYAIEWAYIDGYPKGKQEVTIIGDKNLVKNLKNYVVNLKEMTQTNVQTKYKRKVYREKIDPTKPDSIPNIADKKEEIKQKPVNLVEENEEDNNLQEEKPLGYIIVGVTPESIQKSKEDINLILKSLTHVTQRPLPKLFNVEEKAQIQKIAAENKCIININEDNHNVEFTGYQERIICAEADFWKFVSHNSDNLTVPWPLQKDNLAIIEIQNTDKEFIDVKGQFDLTMKGSYTQFIKVEKIQNTRLWYNFCYENKKLRMKYGKDAQHVTLFHGTKSNDPSKVYDGTEDAFDMRFCDKGMWGIGVYFAVNAKYSNGYAFTNPNGSKSMFLADVIIGDAWECPSDSSLRMPPIKQGGKMERYDSVKGFTSDSFIYIVYANSKAYPKYLITYK